MDWGPQVGLDQDCTFVSLGHTSNKTAKTELDYLNQLIDRLVTPNGMSHGLAINPILATP